MIPFALSRVTVPIISGFMGMFGSENRSGGGVYSLRDSGVSIHSSTMQSSGLIGPSMSWPGSCSHFGRSSAAAAPAANTNRAIRIARISPKWCDPLHSASEG